MNKFSFSIFLLTLLVKFSYGQTNDKEKVYNQEFKWSITVPNTSEKVSAEDWAKIQNKGEQAIENTFEADIENRSKTIFVFKSGQLNFFESNQQPFDTSVDGDFKTSFKAVTDVLYQTFITQMQGIQVDTSFSEEKIDGLKFHVLKMRVKYPNNIFFNVLMYSRLFGKKELTVNIMYVDEEKGRRMKEAWNQSKFAKE